MLIFFRIEISAIVKSWVSGTMLRKRDLTIYQREDQKMGWMIILGSIPVFILGFLLQDTIKTTFRSLTLIAATLIVFGLILGISDYLGSSGKGLKDLKVSNALLFGLGQSLALIPGVSRSGMTIAAGRLMGFNRSAATKFSFLLAIPAVLGSGLYELYQTLSTPGKEMFSLTETASATVVAFVVGYAVIAWLMKFVSTNSYRPFVIYRIVLGTFLFLAMGLNLI